MDAGGVVLFNTGNAAAAAALDTGALSGEEIGEMVNESPSSMGMIGTAHSSTAALVLDPASASTDALSRQGAWDGVGSGIRSVGLGGADFEEEVDGGKDVEAPLDSSRLGQDYLDEDYTSNTEAVANVPHGQDALESNQGDSLYMDGKYPPDASGPLKTNLEDGDPSPPCSECSPTQIARFYDGRINALLGQARSDPVFLQLQDVITPTVELWKSEVAMVMEDERRKAKEMAEMSEKFRRRQINTRITFETIWIISTPQLAAGAAVPVRRAVLGEDEDEGQEGDDGDDDEPGWTDDDDPEPESPSSSSPSLSSTIRRFNTPTFSPFPESSMTSDDAPSFITTSTYFGSVTSTSYQTALETITSTTRGLYQDPDLGITITISIPATRTVLATKSALLVPTPPGIPDPDANPKPKGNNKINILAIAFPVGIIVVVAFLIWFCCFVRSRARRDEAMRARAEGGIEMVTRPYDNDEERGESQHPEAASFEGLARTRRPPHGESRDGHRNWRNWRESILSYGRRTPPPAYESRDMSGSSVPGVSSDDIAEPLDRGRVHALQQLNGYRQPEYQGYPNREEPEPEDQFHQHDQRRQHEQDLPQVNQQDERNLGQNNEFRHDGQHVEGLHYQPHPLRRFGFDTAIRPWTPAHRRGASSPYADYPTPHHRMPPRPRGRTFGPGDHFPHHELSDWVHTRRRYADDYGNESAIEHDSKRNGTFDHKATPEDGHLAQKVSSTPVGYASSSVYSQSINGGCASRVESSPIVYNDTSQRVTILRGMGSPNRLHPNYSTGGSLSRAVSTPGFIDSGSHHSVMPPSRQDDDNRH